MHTEGEYGWRILPPGGMEAELLGLTGVRSAMLEENVRLGAIRVTVAGGDDREIADCIRYNPGILTVGNTEVVVGELYGCTMVTRFNRPKDA